VRAASHWGVHSLFAGVVHRAPRAAAIDVDGAITAYAELADRVERVAGALERLGVVPGDRVAVLSENRPEFLTLLLACARAGAVLACQNWRLSASELSHCLGLVDARCLFVSSRFEDRAAVAWRGERPCVRLDGDLPALLAPPRRPAVAVDPEDPLVILYTSGTTGLPKGACVSHRAMLARNMVVRAEYSLSVDDAYVSWSPLYHIGALDPALGALVSGGKVILVDGYDPSRLAAIVASERVGWLILMPGALEQLAELLEARSVVPRGIKVCGAMPDLVPPAVIARVTRLLGAPFANTFGATETGNPPCSAGLIPVGEVPHDLAKTQSAFCEVRLVDTDGREVGEGEPGEIAVRGPTVFSGYWNAGDANEQDFRGGWFHMGDVFSRRPDGRLDFRDRLKYLIKSGGENVYPAEIERVILADVRTVDCAVVRRAHPRWGEIPVVFVARRDPSLDADEVLALCREHLARYKVPKEIRFLDAADFPRSASGKIQRQALEARLDEDLNRG